MRMLSVNSANKITPKMPRIELQMFKALFVWSVEVWSFAMYCDVKIGPEAQLPLGRRGSAHLQVSDAI